MEVSGGWRVSRESRKNVKWCDCLELEFLTTLSISSSIPSLLFLCTGLSDNHNHKHDYVICNHNITKFFIWYSFPWQESFVDTSQSIVQQCLPEGMVSPGEKSHPSWFSLHWGSVSSIPVSVYDGVVTFQQKEVAPCTLLLYLKLFPFALHPWEQLLNSWESGYSHLSQEREQWESSPLFACLVTNCNKGSCKELHIPTDKVCTYCGVCLAGGLIAVLPVKHILWPLADIFIDELTSFYSIISSVKYIVILNA